MSQKVYRELLDVMKKRGGGYAGKDIPEFFNMVEELFTPEQAEVNNILPAKPSTAHEIADIVGRGAIETEKILENMANNGLCLDHEKDGVIYFRPQPFMPGILENIFIRGGTTEHDKKMARLIDAYKESYNATRPSKPAQILFPGLRAITVDRTIEAGNTVHTYDQVQTYIDQNDSIAVGTCYCRHEADLLGKDLHEMPKQVCMSFGRGAEFTVKRLGGRKVSREEAREILDQAEEAGLIHMTRNVTDNIPML